MVLSKKIKHRPINNLYLQKYNKKVGKAYNAAYARHVDFPDNRI